LFAQIVECVVPDRGVQVRCDAATDRPASTSDPQRGKRTVHELLCDAAGTGEAIRVCVQRRRERSKHRAECLLIAGANARDQRAFVYQDIDRPVVRE
jgi:hypothetical protein